MYMGPLMRRVTFGLKTRVKVVHFKMLLRSNISEIYVGVEYPVWYLFIPGGREGGNLKFSILC